MDQIVVRLLSWYDKHHRELPWRSTRNPYHIWVSEVILQQTRVVQGVDYFVRFIERFPTVESLAEASEDDVMRMWQGLGYYSRARNLQAAARQVVGMGAFPDTYEAIRSLKGVGDYTAAAIASFAFDIPRAAVDGNVLRVWSRMFGVDAPIDEARGKQLVTEIAQALLPVGQAAKYNQAVMEFGITASASFGTVPSILWKTGRLLPLIRPTIKSPMVPLCGEISSFRILLRMPRCPTTCTIQLLEKTWLSHVLSESP